MNIDLYNAKWIWENSSAREDEHAEFFTEFNYEANDGRIYLSISADSDFGIYINGSLFEFGQYPDYPHYKVYDKFDITSALKEGVNVLAIEAWYYGNNCSTNIDDGAGICFSLDSEKGNILVSDEHILSRLSKTYRNHACIYITGQLGFGYGYDATAEDNWKTIGGEDFTPSVLVTPNKIMPSVLRPVDNLVTESAISGKLIKSAQDGKYRYLFDFGRETVGVYHLKFKSSCVQNIELCYGEHIIDGWVRDIIHSRRFTFDYKAKCGLNDYFGYFRRLGLRYAELRCEAPIENIEIDIYPRSYPLNTLPFECNDDDFNRIYKVCVDTLKLCLHEHYEDCPWREQAMYVMDSRNQMLCGYYAFGEYKFPRACLKIMCEDRRDDGMLSITYPGASGLVIPSFGLHLFATVREYGDHSGDWEFVQEIYPKLANVIDTFSSHTDPKSSLMLVYGESCYWNFYEWIPGLDGTIGAIDEERPDLLINTLYSIALQNMQYICDKLGIEATYGKMASKVNESINSMFASKENLLFGMYDQNGPYSELGNALAVLCGAANEEFSKNICELLVDPNSCLLKTTLSMRGFKYDALLRIDDKCYSSYVLEDIRKVYLKMLAEDATSFWETEDGAAAFGNAGSLCHGWSALPIYYLHKLLK
jgi:hypothetical protein